MKYTVEINDIYELAKMTWSGGNTTVEDIIKLDAENGTNYGERLMQFLDEVFADGELPSDTSINDFLWFETDTIYEAIGLNSNGEIPSIVDEAREENRSYIIAKETIEDIKNSGLFEQQFIEFLEKEAEETSMDCITFYFEDLENNTQEVTEEQIEFLEEV